MTDLLPRRLAAILYADVAGYSRLTGEDEDETHRTLSDYLDLISTNIQAHRGHIIYGKASRRDAALRRICASIAR